LVLQSFSTRVVDSVSVTANSLDLPAVFRAFLPESTDHTQARIPILSWTSSHLQSLSEEPLPSRIANPYRAAGSVDTSPGVPFPTTRINEQRYIEWFPSHSSAHTQGFDPPCGQLPLLTYWPFSRPEHPWDLLLQGFYLTLPQPAALSGIAPQLSRRFLLPPFSAFFPMTLRSLRRSKIINDRM